MLLIFAISVLYLSNFIDKALEPRKKVELYSLIYTKKYRQDLLSRKVVPNLVLLT